MPQIRKWAPKFFHVHGKDATVRWDVVREHGVFGKVPFVQMRTPGFGDTDWTRVISELRLAGYVGSIDIEGWHDPVYREELEMTGQVRALDYLKQCRGGARFRRQSSMNDDFTAGRKKSGRQNNGVKPKWRREE